MLHVKSIYAPIRNANKYLRICLDMYMCMFLKVHQLSQLKMKVDTIHSILKGIAEV